MQDILGTIGDWFSKVLADWKLNFLVGASAITLVATIIADLEKISSFLSRLVARLFFKRRYLKQGSWPIKVTISDFKYRDGSLPRIYVSLVLEPRVAAYLGKCTLVYVSANFSSDPIDPLEAEWEKWSLGTYLRDIRRFALAFNAPGIETGTRLQIALEAGSQMCRSNIIEPIKQA